MRGHLLSFTDWSPRIHIWLYSIKQALLLNMKWEGIGILVVNLFPRILNFIIGYQYCRFWRGFTSFILEKMNYSSCLQVTLLNENGILWETLNSNSFPSVFPEDSIVHRCAVEVLCVLLISACKTLRCTVPVCALTHVHTPFMCIVVSACMYICVRASYLGVRDNC